MQGPRAASAISNGEPGPRENDFLTSWTPIDHDFTNNTDQQYFRRHVSGKWVEKIVLQNRVQNRSCSKGLSGRAEGDSEVTPSTGLIALILLAPTPLVQTHPSRWNR
eukprot:9491896-Pyramimonas_sp.AAC.1